MLPQQPQQEQKASEAQQLEDYTISGTWTITGTFHIEASSPEAARQAAQSLTSIESIYSSQIVNCNTISKIEVDPSPSRTFLFNSKAVGEYFVTVKKEQKQQAKEILKQRSEDIKNNILDLSMEEQETYIFNGLKEAGIEYRAEYIQYE